MDVNFKVGDQIGQLNDHYGTVLKGVVIKVTPSGRFTAKMSRPEDAGHQFNRTFEASGRPYPKNTGFWSAKRPAPWNAEMQVIWDRELAHSRGMVRKYKALERRERAKDRADIAAYRYAMDRLTGDPDPRAEHARKLFQRYLPQPTR